MLKTIAAAAAALLAAGPALADPVPGRGSFTLFGGADFPIDGEVHDGAVAPVPDLGGLNPDLAGVSAELRIGARDHEEIYGTAWAVGIEGAWGLSTRGEAFGQIRYTMADEGRVQVGTAFVPALDASLPVFGTFGDYESVAAEIGYRHYLGRAGGIRPYGAARVGGAWVGSIDATFEIPDAAITIPDAPFYEESFVLALGADVGVSIPVSTGFSLQAETGIRWIDDLDGDDSAIGGLGLASINDTGSRLSVPMTLRARFRF